MPPAALTSVRAVLFDMGGTLVEYPLPGWPTILGRCLDGMYGWLVKPEKSLPPRAAQIPPPQIAAARRSPAPPDTAVLHRLTVALRRIVRGASGSTLPHVAEACARPLVAQGRLYPDTIPALSALRDRGYAMGLISNTPWGTPDYLWENQVRRFGLAAYFKVRLFSSGVGYRKPDVRIFQAALRRLGFPAQEAVFVGDNPDDDIAGARQAGMHTALITRAAEAPPAEVPADVHLRTLTDLLDLLPGVAS